MHNQVESCLQISIMALGLWEVRLRCCWMCRSGNWRQDDGASEAFGMSMNIAQIQAMAADLGARTLGQVRDMSHVCPRVQFQEAFKRASSDCKCRTDQCKHSLC